MIRKYIIGVRSLITSFFSPGVLVGPRLKIVKFLEQHRTAKPKGSPSSDPDLQLSSHVSDTTLTSPAISQSPSRKPSLADPFHKVSSSFLEPSPFLPVTPNTTMCLDMPDILPVTNPVSSQSTSTLSTSVPSTPSTSLTPAKRKRAEEVLDNAVKRQKLNSAHFRLSERSSEHIRCVPCKLEFSIAGLNGLSNVYAHRRRNLHKTAVQRQNELKLRKQAN